MSKPIRPDMRQAPIVPRRQVRAFGLAVCRRLGIDPAIVSENDFHWEVNSDEELGRVTLTAFLPADELVAMFNEAGRAQEEPEGHSAEKDAGCGHPNHGNPDHDCKPFTAEKDAAWEPTGWWRVTAPDGSIWCETSVEDEARDATRPGDTLSRQFQRTEREWRPLPPGASARRWDAEGRCHDCGNWRATHCNVDGFAYCDEHYPEGLR